MMVHCMRSHHSVLANHSFIHSGDLYSASSRHYYSEALPTTSSDSFVWLLLVLFLWSQYKDAPSAITSNGIVIVLHCMAKAQKQQSLVNFKSPLAISLFVCTRKTHCNDLQVFISVASSFFNNSMLNVRLLQAAVKIARYTSMFTHT